MSKVIVKDTLNNEYYAVEMTEIDYITGQPTVGNNDFPYWTKNIDEAYNFGSVLVATNGHVRAFPS